MANELKQFPDNVKDMRTTLDITQEELAERSGLHITAISHIETGAREPGLTNFVRLCKGLGCSAKSLIGI